MVVGTVVHMACAVAEARASGHGSVHEAAGGLDEEDGTGTGRAAAGGGAAESTILGGGGGTRSSFPRNPQTPIRRSTKTIDR